jgi:hypothetical protein
MASPRWLDTARTVRVFNSGLEVWLYDEGNREAIVESGALAEVDEDQMRPLFAGGLLAAYSLYQDDELFVGVIVGPPPSAGDLAGEAWLEPQTAFLRLPSGDLCIESNDASRIGPEEPGDDGARIEVPPGDYRLTLYRVDREALEREEREWDGPQEVVVLTPGGTPDQAASGILPFQPRRDLSWVGRYAIDGRALHGLAWFDDYWDTFILNVDRAAADRLGLVPGSCLRTTVPDTGLTLVSAFAASWKDGAALEPPAGVPLDEYGFAALSPLGQWDGAEGLFCRRDRAARAIAAKHRHLWLPAIVEVLDARAETPARVRGPLLFDGGARAYWRGDLRARAYYNDLQLLTARLTGRVEDVPWGEPTPLARALEQVDAAMAAIGLAPLGDIAFDVVSRQGSVEYTNRLYTGLPDAFAAIWGSRGVFEVFFFSPAPGGAWVLTGTVSARVAQMIGARKGLSVRAGEGRFANMLEQHRAHAADAGAVPLAVPADLAAGAILYDGYLKTALD